jgi:hypothetical protein
MTVPAVASIEFGKQPYNPGDLITVTVTGQAGSSVTVNFNVAPRFGMNYDVDAGLPGVAAALGCQPLTFAKVFNSSMPASYPGHVIPATVTHPLAVIKVPLTTSAPWLTATQQAALATVFASMPVTGTPMVSINQEGEAGRFGYSAAQVAGSHGTAYQIFQATAPANAVYCQDLQTYSAAPAGRGPAFADYLCCTANGQQDLPLYLLDWYPTDTTTGAVDSVTPAVGYIRGKVPAAVIGAAECNWLANNGAYHGPGTYAGWFADCWDYATAQDFAVFAPYFLTAHNTPWPPPADVISELSTIAHASGL